MAPPIVSLPPDLVRYPDEPAPLSTATWHLPKATWDPIRKRSKGEGTRCAVLDTGYRSHALLRNPKEVANFTNDRTADDGNGHSTHCRGTISAQDENLGIAPEVEMYIGKVLTNGGSGSSDDIARGILWAIDMEVDVISMSLGGPSAYQPTIDAIKKAISRGIIVCIAAGNSGFNGRSNTVGWPAKSRAGSWVGATRQDGSIANFSSGGNELDVAAPGERILSTTNNGATGFMSGTSMATPFVAGCMCLITSLMRQQGRATWTAIEGWREWLKSNAKDAGKPGFDPSFGYGVLPMQDIVDRLATGSLKLT